MPINRQLFFDYIRTHIKGFNGKLSSSQVEGMTHNLNIWEEKFSDKPLEWLAYAFATNCIETGWTMLPVVERGGPKYFIEHYWTNVKIRTQLGNLSPQDAVDFCGKGDVQATGRRNYTKIKELTGIDVVTSPNKILEPDLSAWSMFVGMINGIYTGKKLSDYFNISKKDWAGARHIINGEDRAVEIGEIGKQFYQALISK